MKIGEEVYVHGYIDEIRNGVIIIRNKGGYFGTEPEEVFPSAQPERRNGKWVDDGTELGCCCSECGVTLDDYFYGELYEVRLGKIPKFCPNCGADMRGGDA